MLQIERLEERLAPAVVVVNQLTDNLPNAGGQNGELRWAIRTANDGDTIEFRNVQQGGTIVLAREIVSSKNNLLINGLNLNLTITTNGNDRALRFSGAQGVTLSVANLTFAGCDQAADGGAIRVDGALHAWGVRFLDNSGVNGGAVAIRPQQGFQASTFVGCTFEDNIAAAGSGGAIFIQGAIGGSGANAYINASTFRNNIAALDGGAIAVTETLGSLDVADSRFHGNSANRDGGAIASRNQSLAIYASAFTSTFEGNQAVRGGAVMWLPDDDKIVTSAFTNATFRLNVADEGGALYLRTAPNDMNGPAKASEKIIGCLFDSNSAAREEALNHNGGAIFVQNWTGNTAEASLEIINTTIANNLALNDGGGVAIRNTNAGTGANTVSFTSVTVYRNVAGHDGGGAHLVTPGGNDASRFWNSIISNNFMGNQGPDIFGPTVSQGFNFIGLQHNTNGAWLQTDMRGAIDPLDAALDPQGLQNNGGYTKTIAVPNTSIDVYRQGDPSIQTAGGPGGLNDVRRFDQRLYRRVGMGPNGAVVTRGAFDPDVPRGNAANNAPQGANGAVTILEDSPYTFAATDFGFSDPNDTPGDRFVAVHISSLPTVGELRCFGQLVTAGLIIGLDAIQAGGLIYYPESDGNGSPYATFGFKVQDDGGTANGGVDTDVAERTMTIHVLGINDAPAISVPGSQGSAQNTSLVFSSATGNAISITDVDAGGAEVQVALTVTHGTLTLADLTGITFVGGSTNGAPTMTFTGTFSAINSALDVLSYSPDIDFHGFDALQVNVDDLGNTGVGGSLTDSQTIAIAVDAGAINGIVWDDTDLDGIQDVEEAGMAGVTVNLFDALGSLVASTTTDALGRYTFNAVVAGNYQIQVEAPIGYQSTAQDQGSDDSIDSDVDLFGYTSLFSLSLNSEWDLDAGFYLL